VGRANARPRDGSLPVRSGAQRGTALLEQLVGTMLALLVLGTLVAVVGTGSGLLVAVAARGETEDTVQLAVEALTFDVRRAGYDPAAAGVPAVSEARTDRLTLAADLNGDGTVAASSEETTAYVCALPAQQLSRIIGRQSLPLAGGVLACGFRYLDATGTPLAVPPAGLDVPGRSRIRAVGLDLTLRLRGTPTTRRVVVALRTSP